MSDMLNPLARMLENALQELDGQLNEHDSGTISETREFAKEARSVLAIAETREQAPTVVRRVIDDTDARRGRPFPGMPGERHDARC